MFLVFYIFRVLLLPHGVRSFDTNLHLFEAFGLFRQRHLPHRLWKRGTYQKSFLGGKFRAFCGCILSLDKVALSMLSWICSVECPYTFFLFFFKLPRFKV